jgi:aminoglycoside/choline kinase family phosphotransferase
VTLISKINLLQNIFERTFDRHADSITPLPRSGSYREYFRIFSGNFTAIGVMNTDRKENVAFLEFTKHFLAKGLKVPSIEAVDLDHDVYLLSDLGDTTLFSYLVDNREEENFLQKLTEIYKKIVEALPYFQIKGNEGLDYSVCYPRARFDKQSMMWDLSYFKYYFLKLAKVPFDEQQLEDDFLRFTDHLLTENNDYFMYRDFQSSNIMLKGDELFFIDYQGGRKGALQYDLASLLFDAKADIPGPTREALLDHYLSSLGAWHDIDEKKFREYYYDFVLIRLLQAMGAFGFRGFYEKKPQFLQSIPYAIKTMDELLKKNIPEDRFPYLVKVLNSMIDSPELKQFSGRKDSLGRLQVEINSFSYRRGIPVDLSENGGGFVFDCRAILNPGRIDEFKDLNGSDPAVIKFFRENTQADVFVNDSFRIIDHAICEYLKRKYTRLMINFGCTGGQHRSIYCAEQIKKLLQKTYKNQIEVVLNHREQEYKKLGI